MSQCIKGGLCGWSDVSYTSKVFSAAKAYRMKKVESYCEVKMSASNKEKRSGCIYTTEWTAWHLNFVTSSMSFHFDLNQQISNTDNAWSVCWWGSSSSSQFQCCLLFNLFTLIWSGHIADQLYTHYEIPRLTSVNTSTSNQVHISYEKVCASWHIQAKLTNIFHRRTDQTFWTMTMPRYLWTKEFDVMLGWIQYTILMRLVLSHAIDSFPNRIYVFQRPNADSKTMTGICICWYMEV